MALQSLLFSFSPILNHMIGFDELFTLHVHENLDGSLDVFNKRQVAQFALILELRALLGKLIRIVLVDLVVAAYLDAQVQIN